jgi:2-polyprenyl-3-methyl-5-hydroxy-6-metoxy-1,4-benzoquinol methylase
MSSTHVQRYNPVRTWVYCDVCHHLYAEEFPIQEVIKTNPNTATANKPIGMKTNPIFFSFYSEVLAKISNLTEGNELLEIGIGGSECALAASEMGFNVFGVDISEGNVLQAQKYGIKAEVHDVMNFEPNKKWDIIIMGDVIEHVGDPVACIEKVRNLLNENGVLWLSTPNFDGSFSRLAGHNDPMRREGGHKNYFSRDSLLSLLQRFNFIPVDYRISSHYNGSMEIISVLGEKDT